MLYAHTCLLSSLTSVAMQPSSNAMVSTRCPVWSQYTFGICNNHDQSQTRKASLFHCLFGVVAQHPQRTTTSCRPRKNVAALSALRPSFSKSSSLGSCGAISSASLHGMCSEHVDRVRCGGRRGLKGQASTRSRRPTLPLTWRKAVSDEVPDCILLKSRFKVVVLAFDTDIRLRNAFDTEI